MALGDGVVRISDGHSLWGSNYVLSESVVRESGQQTVAVGKSREKSCACLRIYVSGSEPLADVRGQDQITS